MSKHKIIGWRLIDNTTKIFTIENGLSPEPVQVICTSNHPYWNKKIRDTVDKTIDIIRCERIYPSKNNWDYSYIDLKFK